MDPTCLAVKFESLPGMPHSLKEALSGIQLKVRISVLGSHNIVHFSPYFLFMVYNWLFVGLLLLLSVFPSRIQASGFLNVQVGTPGIAHRTTKCTEMNE